MTVLVIRKSIRLTVITLTAYFLLVSCSGRQEYTSVLRHFHQDYQAARDTISAIRTAEEAIAIPVNERNLTMRRLHSEVESTLQTLCRIE